MINWNCQGIFYTPAGFESPIDGLPFPTAFFCPLCDAQRFAIEDQKPCSASIVALLASCCPITICLTVWSVIIAPFNFKTWRRLTHVAKKFLKRLPQKLNSAPPVVFVAWVIRILTTLLGVTVGNVGARFFISSNVPMFRKALARSLSVITTTVTTLSVTGNQESFVGGKDRTAPTFAFPRSTMPFWRRIIGRA